MEQRDLGDALIHRSRAPGPPFIEFTEVRWVGDQVLACSPVRGLLHYDGSDPEALSAETPLVVPGFARDYPRCQRIAVSGDRALVAAKRDQIQPDAVVALLDISDPTAPTVVDDLVLSSEADGVAWFGGQPVVATHDGGVLRLDIDGGLLREGDRSGEVGSVRSVTRVGDMLAAGTVDGSIVFLDLSLEIVDRVRVDAAVQAMAALPDGRLAAALGSAGLALVQPPVGNQVARVEGVTDTGGTAVRLGVLGDGSVVVANWRDVRVYEMSGEAPLLHAVETMRDAERPELTLAVDAFDDRVLVGEWSGLHEFHYDPNVIAPELSVASRRVQLAGPQTGRTGTLEIENEGQLDLSVGTPQTTEGWTAHGGDLTLAPGESARIQVEFTGEGAIDRGSLTLPSNDIDEPSVGVALDWGSDGLAVGDEAPRLVGLGINTGELHDVQEMRGRVVVLAYFGTFCPICSAGFPDIEREIHQAYPDDEVVVLGVDPMVHPGEFDDVIAAFIEQTGVTFPVMADTSGTYSGYVREEGSAPFPLNVVIDAEGRIAHIQQVQDVAELTAVIDTLLP